MDHSIDERSLVRQVRDGDEASFRLLYQKYAPRLFAFSKKYLARSEDAEEIVQEVFLRIWEKKANIDEAQSFSSYVFQAARHRIYNGFRKRVNEQAYLDHLINMGRGHVNFTDNALDYSEIKDRAEQAIQTMPPRRREIFRLSREKGLKNREIAKKLDISIKTVENQMGQALRYLKEKLDVHRSMILFFIFLLI